MQLFKRRSRMGNDDILISCLAYGLSFLIILSVIYPLVYVISASISDPMRVENGDLILWPVGFTLEGADLGWISKYDSLYSLRNKS